MNPMMTMRAVLALTLAVTIPACAAAGPQEDTEAADASTAALARDAGDGGYSRTLGGDGGISAERYNYDQTVLNNEFDIAANGGWWSEGVYVGGVGWGGRFGD